MSHLNQNFAVSDEGGQMGTPWLGQKRISALKHGLQTMGQPFSLIPKAGNHFEIEKTNLSVNEMVGGKDR